MSPTPAAAGDALGGSGFLVDLHGRPGGTTLNTHTSKERGAHPNRGDSYLQNIREADKGNKIEPIAKTHTAQLTSSQS